MKQPLKLTALSLFLLATGAISVSAQEDVAIHEWTEPETNITWSFFVTDDFATITASSLCESESVTVPAMVYIGETGYAVKEMNVSDSDQQRKIFGENVKSVNLNTVERMENVAWTQFFRNPQIESVTAPNLQYVNDGIFFDTALKSLALSEACKDIGARALSNPCVQTVTGTSGVEYIGDYAFSGSSIRSIDLSSCKKLWNEVFSDCAYLENVYLGDVIRDFALDEEDRILNPFGNTNLSSVTVHYPENADGELYKTAEIWGLCNYLDADNNGQTYKTALSTGEVWGFTINSDGETATIMGTGVKTVFGNWTGHGEAELLVPSEVTYNDKTYTVTAVGNDAFSQFDELDRLVLPSTITTIGKNAFYGCDHLNQIFIENEDCVITIPDDLFVGLSTPNIYLSVSSPVLASQYAETAGWKDLKVVTGGQFDYTDENGVTWTVETLAPAKWYGYYQHEVVRDNLQDKVTIIGAKNFGSTVNVPYTVTIANSEYYVYGINGDNSQAPEKVEGREAFPFCQDIVKVVLPPSVKELGWGAFRECYNLESINLENVEKLHDWCFGNCNKLKEVNLENAQFVGAGVFSTDDPAGKALAKATLSPKCKFIYDGAFANCNNLVDMGDVSGVEALGRNAFENTTKLESLNFTSALKQIGNQTFESSAVKNVGNTSGVVSMGWGAFRNSKIQKVDLSSCALLDEWVFDSCNDLEEVGSVAHLLGLGHGVFWDCTSLKKLDLSNRCTYLGHRAVAGCTSLTTVGDLTGLEYIESFAFDGDRSLTTLDIPKASHIGENAFLNCSAKVNYVNGTTFVPEGDPDYSLYVDNVEVAGNKLIIPIKLRMKAGSTVCAFQSDIKLPAGCSATSFGLNNERIDINATAMSSYASRENGSSRATGVSFPCLPFLGEDGVIGTLVVDMNGVQEGEYSPLIQNVVLATAEGNAIYVGANNFTFDIQEGEGGKPGDMTGDGAVTIADAVVVMNYYLNMSGTGEIELKYDVNHDGKITMADVVAIMNLALTAK